MLIYFLILTSLCILEINLAWARRFTLLVENWIQFACVLLRVFLFRIIIFISKTDQRNCEYTISLLGFDIRVILTS